MINYYQPFLFPFLGSKKHNVHHGVVQRYYHSFEDALWDVLKKRVRKKGSVLLLPSFYCADVLQNIKNHGYRYYLYNIDRHFNLNKKHITALIKKIKPDLFVIFHACGIHNPIISDTKWMKDRLRETIILEDCVHLLLDPKRVKIFHKNHYVIDSIRKVSPLPGSFLYCLPESMPPQFPQRVILSWYQVKSYFWFILFKLCFVLGNVINNPFLVVHAHRILKRHDDIIGDSKKSFAGFPLFSFLFQYFDFKKVQKMKQAQVQAYQDYIAPLFSKSKLFYRIKMKKRDYGSLHVYPLGVKKMPDHSLISFLHKKKILVWFKFEDSPWSRNRGVLFFPLGFHMNEVKIRKITNALYEYDYDYDSR